MFARIGYAFLLVASLKFLICETKTRLDEMCDSGQFFKPYVELLTKRGGKPIYELLSAGFVDLRNQYGVLLCINGPAYLYGGIEEVENVTSHVPKMLVFTNATLKLYTHECFLINRPEHVPKDPNNPAHSSVGYPAHLLNASTVVHGVRAYGITLLGARGNYAAPSLYMFNEPNFDHNDKGLIISSSFAIIGRNKWKAYDRFTNSTLTIASSASTDEEFCTRPQGMEDFDAIFQRGHQRTDYTWIMVPLPPGRSLAPVPPATAASPGSLAPPERSKEKPIDRIGRLINPVLLGSGYSHSSNLPGDGTLLEADEHGDNSAGAGGKGRTGRLAGNQKPGKSYDFPEDTDPTITKQHKNIMAQITVCKPLPKLTDFCLKPGSTPEESCKVLTSVLELDPRDWTNDADIKDLAWKKDILDLVQNTFINICPHVKQSGPQSVANVFLDIYILDVHKANPSLSTVQNSAWQNLKTELTHCQNESTALEFREYSAQFDEPLPVETPHPLPMVYIAPESTTNETTTVVPPTTQRPATQAEILKLRRLNVKRMDGSDSTIFHYVEAADADFNFNTGIDFQWKMFSTVIGYCNKFYESKKSSVFPRLLSLFTDDFLTPNLKEWVNPARNDVYNLIMGDGDKFLDECLEGAYIHSDSEDYRPVRPISINDGQHMNHFTLTPPQKGDK